MLDKVVDPILANMTLNIGWTVLRKKNIGHILYRGWLRSCSTLIQRQYLL